jgi:hypothetical protein
MAASDMARGREPRRPDRANGGDFVFWDPCVSLAPIVVPEPRDFWLGQAIVVAVALALLGALVVLASWN